MLQEEDFHFCLLISQQGLCGPSSHLSLSFPNPNILHKKKRASDKKPPILRPNPSYTGLTLRGKLAHCAPSFRFSFPLSLPGPGIYLPRPAREGPLRETATARPGVMEGKIPLFHVPVSLRVQKHRFPTFTSAAQLHFGTNTQHVKIDLPLKASEETQMAISYTHMYVCMYPNVPTQRKMCTLIILTAHVRAAHPFVL